jgi:hypothetical protein
MSRRTSPPRQARFQVELKKLLKRGVAAPRAMKLAWKRVPKNPRHHRARTAKPTRRNAARRRSGPAPVVIYDRIEKIYATKAATNPNYPAQRFVHTFTKPAQILGMPDGSLRIRPRPRS